MASSSDRLTRIQRELLDAFFEKETGFFLTGGAALAGFHLRHRRTDDLDLFTCEEEAFERGRYAFQAAVNEIGAVFEVRQSAPGFHRFFVERGNETVVVDLVWERVRQLDSRKTMIGKVRVDVPAEIFANKLNTLVSRSEMRDLVDVMMLERSGCNLDDAVEAAMQKDAGFTPATLAWMLSQVQIGDAAKIPADIPAEELRQYVKKLIIRLRRKAAPA
jgi:hypothetical protein